MNIQEAKQRLINWCLAQLSYAEGADNWNKYAEKWTAAGGWNAQNQPWCDVFVDAGFIECFGLDLASKLTYQPKGGFSAKCSISADYYKNNGAYFYSPEVGDQVFFNVDGGINHTGIVVEVSGGVVETVEGNSSDSVRNNAYAIGSSYINGYGRPKWSVVVNNESSTQAPAAEGPSGKPADPLGYKYHAYTYNVAVSLLKKGDFGPQVKHMQQLLNANGFPCEADGKFGDKTFEALKAFQNAAKIDVDGEWGGQSFKAMWNYGG